MDLEGYKREQLILNSKLDKKDIEQINECRRDYTRLGFGYQIGFVRNHNRFPTQQPFEIVPDLLAFISVQLQIDTNLIHQYQRRQPTISQHQERIREYLRKRKFEATERQLLGQFLFSESCRLEQTNALLLQAEQFLKENHILCPATSTLQRIIGEQRTLAQQHIFKTLAEALPKGIDKKLDVLLEVDSYTVSPIQQLKEPPGKASTSAMKRLTDKLACIEETGILEVDLRWLNNNYQRALASYVRGCNAYWLRQIEPAHRYAALVCYLKQTYADTIDFVIEIHAKLMNRVEKQAKSAFDVELLQRRRSINESLSMFLTVGGVVLDEAVSDKNVRSTIFSQVNKEDLAKQMKQLADWEKDKPNHVFRCVVSQFSYLRKFSPAFVNHLESDPNRRTLLVDATNLLKEMNESGKRKLPEEAPISFIPRKLRGLVLGEDTIDKHAWECALMTKVRDEIKSGNLTVKNSKRFGSFDRFFIPENQWESMREEFFGQSGLPVSGEDAAFYLTDRLKKAYDRFLTSLPQNTYAKVDGDKWHLSVDSPEPLDPTHQAKLKQLKRWLEKKMRHIKLPQLLIEVDNELKFTRHFCVRSSLPPLGFR